MIICIQPIEQGTGRTDPNKGVFLEISNDINPDKEIDSIQYGENYSLVVDHFVKLGAKIIDNPVKIHFV